MDTPDISYEDVIADYEDTGPNRAYLTAKQYGIDKFVRNLYADETVDLTDKFTMVAAFLTRLAQETGK